MPPRTGLRADEAGASAVELAFILPVILLVVYGGIELARFHYLQSGIQSAASVAIRHATAERAIIVSDLRNIFFTALATHDPALVTTLDFRTSPHTLSSVERLEIAIDYRFEPVSHVIIPGTLDLDLVVRGLVPISN